MITLNPQEKPVTQPEETVDPTKLHDPMLQFFKFAHLKPELQQASIPFWQLACELVANLPRNPERTVALRKLLEAKDCAVRSVLYQSEENVGVEQVHPGGAG
jgi:hypothetical protein